DYYCTSYEGINTLVF
nr:immunoglobulin light chain junction region [Macaca mulatta]MOX30971.1 immunoglobulin light chain junction region [Macaca mulatta]MOX32069.1 immunoglobulin light chain junction region [Macaca mulatta]MOX32982.1 immunoglobulin light chain junction region [Macaca mulatta]